MTGRVASVAAKRLRRTIRVVVPLVQVTAAATVAWVIAVQLGRHEEPFFAPIAVVVALSSPLGERGSKALRLLTGEGPFRFPSFSHLPSGISRSSPAWIDAAAERVDQKSDWT